jgi:hypothetical protein
MTFKKLAEKIKADTGETVGDFQRLYPGYWQKKAGAWSFCARMASGHGTTYEIGSCETAKSLLMARKIGIVYDRQRKNYSIEIID